MTEPVLRVKGNQKWFRCPGCLDLHMVDDRWVWSGDTERPTFSPSVIIKSGHYAEHHKAGSGCWCTYNAEQIAKGEEPSAFHCHVCHFWLSDGKYDFQDDCTHLFQGMSGVPMIPVNMG